MRLRHVKGCKTAQRARRILKDLGTYGSAVSLVLAAPIRQFTGISDPYEAPRDADLAVDTTHMNCQEAVELILAHVRALRTNSWAVGQPAGLG